MAVIFLVGQELEPDKNISLYFELAHRLKQYGHDVIEENIDFGNDFNSSFQKALSKSDVVIPIITKYSISSSKFYNQLVQLSNYVLHREGKILIPVISKDVPLQNVPDQILAFKFIRILNKFEPKEIDETAKSINDGINSFLGKKIATDEKAKVIQEKIEKTAPGYIEDTINELNRREKYQKIIALFWYFVGFLSLIIGVGVALYFSDNALEGFKENENWSLALFFTLKSIFIIVLLIASSKYSFTLAKSYMGESLKIADRIHAISFGKFYLQVFNDQITPTEIKEIFRDWNINNQQNYFSSQTTNDYDPKLIEKIIDLIDKVKNTKSE